VVREEAAMRWIGAAVAGLAMVCAPAVAWAHTCRQTCANDLVVDEVVPVGAGGVLLYTWDGSGRPSLDGVDVRVEQRADDGTFREVPFTTAAIDEVGSVVTPEAMEVGDVFRIESTFGGSRLDCRGATEGAVVHEFEVVPTPSGSLTVGLSVDPPEVSETRLNVYDWSEMLFRDETFAAVTSQVSFRVDVPPELEAIEEALRVEVYLDGEVFVLDALECYPSLHWEDYRVREGASPMSYRALCEALDEGVDVELDTDVPLARPDGALRARVFMPGTSLEWWSEEVPLTFGCPDPAERGGEDAGEDAGDAGTEDVGVSDEGGDTISGGCAQGGQAEPSSWWLVGVVLVGMRRRAS
jgi:hypothetical protein